jgi:glyoxylase-like metal-dependent hydrolase (beta-lactamase superfamily II)
MECTIIAHQKTAQIFRSRPSVFKGQNAESGSEWETQNETVGTRWAVPDITFTQKVSLYWGPPDVNLEHHPGPTPGSIWVVLEVKIIFVGDAVLPPASFSGHRGYTRLGGDFRCTGQTVP